MLYTYFFSYKTLCDVKSRRRYQWNFLEEGEESKVLPTGLPQQPMEYFINSPKSDQKSCNDASLAWFCYGTNVETQAKRANENWPK